MNVLGIACHYHDSGACLFSGSRIVGASQEERFTRVKNAADFPLHAINSCLQDAGLTVFDLDAVGVYEKPFHKFSRVVIDHLRAWPFSLGNFERTMPLWLQDRLILPMTIKTELGFEKDVFFIPHHLAHASSAFLVSPFEEAAIVTADGVGEWATTTCGTGTGTKINIDRHLLYPDSLGLLYSAVTTHLGFSANRGEGKVMGLAAYGNPTYLEKFREIVCLKDDGSFKLDGRYFGFVRGRTMYSRKFVKNFGPARVPESELEQRHFDIAASLQKITEEVLISICRNVQKRTKLKNLTLAGGVFLNCVANHRILEETDFEKVFIQPASGDAGGSLGVAAYITHCIHNNPRTEPMTTACLGPEYDDEKTRRLLASRQVKHKKLSDNELFDYVAEKINDNKIIGWMQGRMEFGPRALGNRSIIASPCAPGMKDHINHEVKHRESFRPYAPAVKKECAGEFFELCDDSPFMLLSPKVKPGKREVIPAVTHVDGTARVQTVDRNERPRFWKLIDAFEKISGVPVLLNTSFNLRGEPIVCSPEDALKCFESTNMDVLVIGSYVVESEKKA